MERSAHLPPWPHPAFSPKLTFIADTTKPTSIPAITARGLSGSTASYVGVINRRVATCDYCHAFPAGRPGNRPVCRTGAAKKEHEI